MAYLSVGGLVAFSTVDYPGKLAAVVFCQGCPWRCEYCHNPHLLPFAADPAEGWERARAFLERRRGLLDSVVFSGGEPTSQPDLAACVREAKEMGFSVGLHTGGAYPKGLESALPWLDWVGLDIKAGFAAYPEVTGVAGSGKQAEASLHLILQSGIDYECRTTLHPAQLSYQDVFELASGLASIGVRRYVVQQFRPMGCGNEALRTIALQPPPEGWKERMHSVCEEFTFREG